MDSEARANDTHGAPPPDRALADLAGRQHGVVSGRQLRSLGLTRDAVRRRVESGRLIRLHRGVFAVGHAALTADARRLAAVMACGPESMLSHRAAGALHYLLPPGQRLELTVPRGRKGTDGIEIHTSAGAHPGRPVDDPPHPGHEPGPHAR